MDNNYQQQFAQSLQAVPQPVEPTNNSKLPLIIAAVLAAITLVESIALVISLVNQSNLSSEEEYVGDEEPIGNESEEGLFNLDEQNNLTSINLTCKSEDGAYFKFDNDNNYQEYNSSGQMVSSGTYSIIRDSIIPLTSNGSSNRTVYYDGIIIADGKVAYDCFGNTESTDEE